MDIKRYIKLSYEILDHKGFAYYLTNVKNVNRVDNDSTIAVLIGILGSRKGNSKTIKVSMKILEERTKLSRTQISRHLQRLIEDGTIKVSQKCNGFNDFEPNEYTLLYNEDNYVIIPFEIAFNSNLSHNELVSYCRLKQNTDLEKMDFYVYGTKDEFVERLKVTQNHVDKVKRSLKKKAIISYERNSKRIELTLEKEIYKQRQEAAKITLNNAEIDNVVKTTAEKKVEVVAYERNSSISL